MKKILVANRGEIALRIMKSARDMGIKSVAVYSEADRNSPHVRYADEAYLLGPPPSNQSYLLGDKIIEICKENNVDAIHPGYGFLSENGEFAEKVEQAGITFIGPKAKSMRIMGDKLAAKEAAKAFDIPLVPGTEDELHAQVESAISEAKSSFGNGAVFIEKYVASPRHIEVQVLCDQHGNCLHLFERECSIQRRHQKVIEEAPSSVLTPELREQMGQKAIDVARSCDYIGAGTVEFIFDENHNFYFMEMNTRLQVEHPVTEQITGVDLVKEQIKVARGEKLSLKQEDLKIKGHAIETRVYAEDPTSNFVPDIGKLKIYRRPEGIGVRVDDGYEEGMDIPIYYDPMIAKLVSYGKDRQEAIERMIRAIEDYRIVGIRTTLPFGRYVMEHPSFTSGDFDTHFVAKHYDPEKLIEIDEVHEGVAAMVSAHLLERERGNTVQMAEGNNRYSAWKVNRK